MLYLHRILLRLKSLFHREALDDQLSSELDFHLAEQKAELIANGMSPAEAEYEARKMFGPVSPLREQCRDARSTQWLEDFTLDTRHTLRSLRNSPTFSLVAILTLALGIGANTAFFSTAYGILFRPLPYPNPDRLIQLEEAISGIGPVTTLRQLSKAADYAGYFVNNNLTLQFSAEASKVTGANVTYNFARVLGIQPAQGRWFTELEERSGQNRLAVLSHRAWRERFSQDPSILGRRITLNEQSYEVIAVMPPGFGFPTPQVEIWLPIDFDPRQIGNMWGSGNLQAIGRLHPEATIESAQSEMLPIIARILPMFPWRMPDAYGRSTRVVLHEEAVSKLVRPKLLVLSAATLLLLLIACGNVGNLLLARGVQRQREFAMREALGANPARLLRQSITENLVLALLGGAAGLVAAAFIFQALPFLFPTDTPRLTEIVAEPKLILGALASLLLTIFLFTAAPLLRSPLKKTSLAGRASTPTAHSANTSLLLIGVELALATTLLIGAGLMGRTIWQLATIDAGTDANQLMTARMSAGPSRCAGADRCAALIEEFNSTLLSNPSIQKVNWSNFAPLDREFSAMASELEDHPKAPGEPAYVLWQTNVSSGYFKALNIPLRQGRYFDNSDGKEGVLTTIISESTARRFWPNQSPIGKRIRPMAGREQLTIVGVVGDVSQYSLAGFPDWVDGVHYRPIAQTLPRTKQALQLTMLIESASPGNGWLNALRQRFPDVVISRVQTLGQIRSESISDQRSTAWLLALFAILGLVLGVAGVHGVISHRAIQRTREIGIRLALGATPARLIRMVMRETVIVSVAGAGFGVVVAYSLSRYLKSLIFGITIHDPLAFAICPAILLIAATFAAALPALRLTRTDPAITLRQD